MSFVTRTTKHTEDEFYLQLQINQFCKYILSLKYYFINTIKTEANFIYLQIV